MKASEILSTTDKPTVIVCHDGTTEPIEADIFTIDPDSTRQAADTIAGPIAPESIAAGLIRLVFGPDWTDKGKGQRTEAERHVVGLVALHLYARRWNIPALVRYPETFLHPKQQLGLADLFLELRK